MKAAAGRVEGCDATPAAYDLEAFRISNAVSQVAIAVARAAVAFVSKQGWHELGYARAGDLTRERYGRTSRWLSDQAALGRAVSRWPRLGRALTGEGGGRPLGKVAATLIGRVASDVSIADWIELARRVTVRKLKAVIRSALAGDASALSLALGSPACSAVVSDPEGVVAEQCADQSLVSLESPAPLWVAFDETFAVYRAVVGGEARIVSFVDGLVGEALSGPLPFEVTCSGVDSSLRLEALEEKLEQATDAWAALWSGSDAAGAGDGGSPPGSALVSYLSAPELSRLAELAAVAGTGDVAELDRQLRELIRIEDVLERRLGQVLSRMGEQEAWSRLRFAGVYHYGEQRLGLQRTAVYHRLRLARALRRFPLLRQAYESGAIGQEAALIVVRLLGDDALAHDPNAEQAWVARAMEATVKRLRDEARAIARSAALAPAAYDGAGDGGSSVDTNVFAPPDDGRRKASMPLPLGDAEWHGSLRHGRGDLRERVLALCERAVDESGVGRAVSKHSYVFRSFRLPSDLARDFLSAIEGARLGLAEKAMQEAPDERDASRPVRPSLRAAREFTSRGWKVPVWVGLMHLLEEFVEIWDAPAGPGLRRPTSADLIYIREGWRCFAPGCTSRRHLEDHHVVYKSRGGDKRDPSNRVCLCRFHHQRGEHGDLTSCRGTAPLGLTFRLGRAAPGLSQWYRNERRVQPPEP